MSLPYTMRLKSRLTGAWLDFHSSEYDLIVFGDEQCECEEPYLKTHTDGRLFCTRCGHAVDAARAALAQSTQGEAHE